MALESEVADGGDQPDRPLYTTSLQVSGVKSTTPEQQASVLLPVNLRAMTATLTKKETLDEKVEKALSVLAEDIVDDVIDFACRLAKHRGSNSLHRNDVRLAFEKRFKVRVPTKSHPAVGGLSASGALTSINSAVGNAHIIMPSQPTSTANYKSNLALVKKA